MSLIDNIGKFSVNGSIDTQFSTSLALERIAIASGERVGGLTSFLATLELIGKIVLMLIGLFIIASYIIIYTVIYLCRLYRWIFPSEEQIEANNNYMSDEEVEEKLSKFDLTDEDMEEINNYN